MYLGKGNTGGNAPAGQWRGAARGNQPYARGRGGGPQGEKPLAIRPAGASPESPIREGVAPDPVVTPVATPATRQSLGRSNTLQPKAKAFEPKQPSGPTNLPPAPGQTGAPAETGATPLPGCPPASGQSRIALPLRSPLYCPHYLQFRPERRLKKSAWEVPPLLQKFQSILVRSCLIRVTIHLVFITSLGITGKPCWTSHFGMIQNPRLLQ